MNKVSLITAQHQSTSRNYLERMCNDKTHCMNIASQFEREYWDGDRKYGYGGYRYDGRWEPIARELISRYNLTENSKVLDLGCGKAHILFELKKLLPDIELIGLDISHHGITTAPEEIKDSLIQFDLRGNKLPYDTNQFDLVISLNTFHNFGIKDLVPALRELVRVGKHHYFCVESFRNNEELFNLQCWALTCRSFHTPEDWEWILQSVSYTGDYEFIYFE